MNVNYYNEDEVRDLKKFLPDFNVFPNEPALLIPCELTFVTNCFSHHCSYIASRIRVEKGPRTTTATICIPNIKRGDICVVLCRNRLTVFGVRPKGPFPSLCPLDRCGVYEGILELPKGTKVCRLILSLETTLTKLVFFGSPKCHVAGQMMSSRSVIHRIPAVRLQYLFELNFDIFPCLNCTVLVFLLPMIGARRTHVN